jgi:hypothetical protein
VRVHDCGAGTRAHAAWGVRLGGETAITMFGAPSDIVYGGCTAGPSFGTHTVLLPDTRFAASSSLRVDAAQSSAQTAVLYDLSGVEVLMAGAAAQHTNLPPADIERYPECTEYDVAEEQEQEQKQVAPTPDGGCGCQCDAKSSCRSRGPLPPLPPPPPPPPGLTGAWPTAQQAGRTPAPCAATGGRWGPHL